MDNKKHIEAIESCRRGSDDLSEFPETKRAIQQNNTLQAFASYVAETDNRMAQWMHAVDIPDGLAERLHSTLQSTGKPSLQPNLVDEQSRIDLPRRFRRLSRHQWTSLAVALAVSAAFIMMATSFALRSWNSVDIDQLVTAYDESETKLADWTPFSPELMPDGYRFPKSDLLANPISWQLVNTSVDRTTQVISLDGNAKLLIVRAKYSSSLPNRPLDKIYERTGGRIFTAWSDNGLVYLVAANNKRALRKLFPSTPSIAFFQRPPYNFRQSA